MQIPIIDLKESLLSDNDRDADKLRWSFARRRRSI